MVAKEWQSLVDAADATSPTESDGDAFVHQIVDDWRKAPLRDSVAQLLAYTERLTLTPAKCSAADIAELQSAGWSDIAIHDTVQVVSYFNYINRVADALGVEPEKGLPHWGRATIHASASE